MCVLGSAPPRSKRDEPSSTFSEGAASKACNAGCAGESMPSSENVGRLHRGRGDIQTCIVAGGPAGTSPTEGSLTWTDT